MDKLGIGMMFSEKISSTETKHEVSKTETTTTDTSNKSNPMDEIRLSINAEAEKKKAMVDPIILANLEKDGITNPINGLNDPRLQKPEELEKDGYKKYDVPLGFEFEIDYDKGTVEVADRRKECEDKEDMDKWYPCGTYYCKMGATDKVGSISFQYFIFDDNNSMVLISKPCDSAEPSVIARYSDGTIERMEPRDGQLKD